MHGICRLIEQGGGIIEAVYVDNKKTGYGRIIDKNGNYYLGML